MTVEVPVHVSIEFDEPLQVDKDTEALGGEATHRLVDSGIPTDQFKQAVRAKLRQDGVSVEKVYAATCWNLSTND